MFFQFYVQVVPLILSVGSVVPPGGNSQHIESQLYDNDQSRPSAARAVSGLLFPLLEEKLKVELLSAVVVENVRKV